MLFTDVHLLNSKISPVSNLRMTSADVHRPAEAPLSLHPEVSNTKYWLDPTQPIHEFLTIFLQTLAYGMTIFLGPRISPVAQQ